MKRQITHIGDLDHHLATLSKQIREVVDNVSTNFRNEKPLVSCSRVKRRAILRESSEVPMVTLSLQDLEQKSGKTPLPRLRNPVVSYGRLERISTLKTVLKEDQDPKKLRGTLAAERLESRNRRRTIEELSSDLIDVHEELKAEKQKNALHEENLAQQNRDLAELRNLSSTEQENCKILEEKAMKLGAQLQDAHVKIREEKEKSLCNICCDRPRDALCMPCLHLYYCFQCLQQHQEKNKTCPYCRVLLRGIVECFM